MVVVSVVVVIIVAFHAPLLVKYSLGTHMELTPVVGRLQLTVTQLVVTPDAMRPYVVVCHFEFQGHCSRLPSPACSET